MVISFPFAQLIQDITLLNVSKSHIMKIFILIATNRYINFDSIYVSQSVKVQYFVALK